MTLALLVEDDVDLGITLSEILYFLNVPGELVTDGLRALRWLADYTPQLILLDLHLPNCSGIEILSSIRRNERFKSTKVVVITADRFINPANLFQADAILYKPFTIDALSSVIDTVMNDTSLVAKVPIPIVCKFETNYSASK
jgi:DNA-binding response OmpR family regulator